MNKTDLFITAINQYPVRSCAGQSLLQANLSPNGLLFDRVYRLVTADGRYLTQLECPKMALVIPTIIGGKLQLRFGENVAPPCVESSVEIPMPIYDHWLGIDQGSQIADWFASVLNVEARLVRVISRSGDVDFARPNMEPIHIISEESFADLKSRFEDPLDIRRFRPTMVYSGGEQYEEDTWLEVEIGDVIYSASPEPCGRCTLINVDPEKGEKSGKPLKTLATYRLKTFETAIAGSSQVKVTNHIIFGKYLAPQTAGIVRVGDRIVVKSRY